MTCYLTSHHQQLSQVMDSPPEETAKDFYENGAHYWAEVPATIDGMLGGFGFVSQTDIQGSKMLLKQLFDSRDPPGRDHVLDCGAGIGRITKHLLSGYFKRVDLVEQNPEFLEQAKAYLGPLMVTKIGDMYPVGLQDFEPEEGKYDVIWIQWVLGHLTDSDFVRFFRRCKKALKPNGVMIVKENITSGDEVETDDTDSSVTRPFALLKRLFAKADLDCSRQVKQNHFPKGLYSVYMFVLKVPKIIETDENVCHDTKTTVTHLTSENVEIAAAQDV